MNRNNERKLQSKRILLNPIQEIDNVEIKNIIDLITKISSTWQNSISFEIKDRINSTLFGYCGLIPCNNLKAACFYFLYPQYRNNGYAIEATRRMFEFAFMDLQIQQIIAYILVGNQYAWKVAERVGMMYMGEFINESNLNKVMKFQIEKSDFENQMRY
ncbi:MAG: GNAT family N-acetyltransferase [Candidatus Thorarchaeota archaeon]